MTAGELEHRQPGIDVGAPPVAGHGDERVVADPERRPRVAAWVMSESNWPVAALKPSWSASRIEATAPSATSSGPACKRSPSGRSGAASRATIRTPSPSLTTHARRGA